jgi:hypothetical protein
MKKNTKKKKKTGNWRWERHKEDNLTTNEKLVESGPYRERRQTKTLSH